MGFSTVASFILMFLAMILIVSSAAILYTSYIQTTNNGIEFQREKTRDVLNTQVEIISVDFAEDSPDTTTIYVKNTGRNTLDKDLVDVFIDSIKIPRNPSNRSIDFNGTNIQNPLHWDPDETLKINISLDLETGGHTIYISTEYGITDSVSFTV